MVAQSGRVRDHAPTRQNPAKSQRAKLFVAGIGIPATSQDKLTPMIWAIIPVKRLRESKQRLAHILSADERADLIHATFSHLLDTLTMVEPITCVLVISDVERVLATARGRGCEVWKEKRPFSLNTAVSQAITHAETYHAKSALILPADLPFAQPADINTLLNMAGYDKMKSIVLSSNEEGTGTNAMLLPLPAPFRFQYGKGSYQRHIQEANRLGFAIKAIQTDALQFDLDTESDWQRYQKTIDNG